MRGFGLASAATALLAATSMLIKSVVADVDPIVINGSKFFYKTNGTEFFIKGIAYQQGQQTNGSLSTTNTYTDPLADITTCQRDIPYLTALSMNTIRVYYINASADHSACMNALADAGIYVIADLTGASYDESIDSNDPDWTTTLYAREASVIDALANYTNTLGFFAGNEVANAPNVTNAAPFCKAAVRDMKAYIAQQGYRSIGVGYATDDNEYIRDNMAEYFNCGDQSDAVDFWGYNIYSWCGDSTYAASGYEDRTEFYSNYSVPVFFAEYGCNTIQPRTFTEVAALYGDEMSQVFSGGIVYMYFEESNNYGVVTVSGDTVSTLAGYSYLSTQMGSASPTGTASSAYTPSNSAAACPTVGTNWSAAATPLPPSPNAQLCACMYSSLNCVADTSNTTAIADDFNYLYGLPQGTSEYGLAIAHNGTTGTYGAYGMCDDLERLAWMFNEYYAAHSSATSACDFNGVGKTQSPAKATGVCSSLLAQAGTAGTGTVTSAPTGTAASGSGSSGTSSASSSKAAANALMPRAAGGDGPGVLSVVVLGVLAAVSGMGMLAL